jgi:hypothetical protein
MASNEAGSDDDRGMVNDLEGRNLNLIYRNCFAAFACRVENRNNITQDNL